MKTKFTFNLLIGLFLLATTTIQAQFQWAFTLNGGGGIYEKGKKLVTDANGNVYTGGEYAGNMDFDQGSGTTVISSTSTACFVQKTDASGNFVWAIKYGGYSVDGISRDASGNLLLCGFFYGTADFDPGVGTYTLASINGSLPNTYALKLDPNGNFLWAVRFGDSNTSAKDILNDASGNVFITGGYSGVQDFDPSAATFTMGTSNVVSGYVLKLNSAGNFTWVKEVRNVSVGTSATVFGAQIDGAGNVITTGVFNGTADFDPSASSYTLSAASFAYASSYVQKLDASGNFVWAVAIGGPSVTMAAYDVDVDASNNIYSAGNFANAVDFDPGASVTTLSATGVSDAYIWKLDMNGNFIWAKGMGNNSWAICLDAAGDVYSAAYASTGEDIDPGAGTYTVTGSYLQKLDASGNFAWGRGYGAFPAFNDIAVSGADVYFTGRYTTTVDFDPDVPVFNLVGTMAGYNLFVSKLTSYSGSSTLVNELTAPSTVYKVYPNPAKNTLNIIPNNPYTGHVNLFDYQGKLIYSEKINDEFQILLNIEKYQAGIYFLKLNDVTTKIIIED